MTNSLIAVSEPSDTAVLDVVFIHGLTGDPYTTWRGKASQSAGSIRKVQDEYRSYEQANKESMGLDYWPQLLVESLHKRIGDHRINVWSLAYPAPLRKKEDPFAFEELLLTSVANTVATLVQAKIGVGDRRSVVFISHSLGGLAVKAILAHCDGSTDAGEKQILNATKAVVFLATPHSGAGLADLFVNLGHVIEGATVITKVAAAIHGVPIVGTVSSFVSSFAKGWVKPSNQIKWLEKANPELRHLAQSYRKIADRQGIITKAYYETQPLHTAGGKFLWVVDASNADPGILGLSPKSVPGANHIEICKPQPGSTLTVDIEDLLIEVIANRERGREKLVLETQISAICNAVKGELGSEHQLNPRFDKILASVPRRLTDIPAEGNLRRDFSHAFRNTAIAQLDQKLGEDLRSNPYLCKQLSNSDWDLDRLILFLWRSHELKSNLRAFRDLLEKERERIAEYETKQPPSVIPIFRLTDALRVAFEEEIPGIRKQLRTTFRWIKQKVIANPALSLDKNGRTRKILFDGEKRLKGASLWETPEPTVQWPHENSGKSTSRGTKP